MRAKKATTRVFVGGRRSNGLPNIKIKQLVVAALLIGAVGTALVLYSKASPTSRALLIHTGFDIPSPSKVSTNKAWIDALPFDGISVSLPTLDGGTFSTTPHSLTEYQNAVAPMPLMTNVKHNFVRVTFTQPTYDWYNDSEWATRAANAGNLAAAVGASGKFDGIMIDPEYYGSGSSPWNYGTGSTAWTYSATTGATPGHQPADAIAKTQARGQQIANAIKAKWPSAKIIFLHGPYVSEPKSGQAMSPFYNDVAYVNELMGPFQVGMVQSVAGSSMQFNDGGEIYGARTTTDFQKAYDWQKTGLANSGTMIMPATFTTTYKNTIRASIGVYDKDILTTGWPTLSASTWQTLLTNAMNREDDYVWSYSEAYDWLKTGWPSTPVPQSYIDATRTAVASAAPTTTDTSPPTASITSPVSGATVSGTVNVTAAASDNVGITKLEFYVDNILSQSGTTTSYTWDTSKVTNGSHSLQVKAYDGAGNTTNSTVVSVTVSNTTTTTGDTTKPTVAIVGVSNSQTVSGKISISANATDNVGISKVEFYLDGALNHSESKAPYCLADDNGTTCYAWDTTKIANGGHTLLAKAYDTANNVGASSLISFTINNQAIADTTPPTIVISQPTNGSHVSGHVTIAASANDNIGVSYIQLDIDGVLFASAQSSTISASWNTNPGRVSSGNHTITVTARDDAGNTATSSITVAK